MVIVVGELGHVHQPVDLRLVELDEQAEAGDAADDAVELAADVLLHPRGAITFVHFALCLVGAARAFGALQRQRRHRAAGVRIRRRLAAGQRVLDRAMHQQIRVAPDR